MKKWIVTILCISILLTCSSALADTDTLPFLNSQGYSRVHSKGDLPVYTGPGPGYYRSASGKAAISNSQAVTVYGEVNGYLLVSYETMLRDTDVARFAYAPVDNVDNGYSFDSIIFDSQPITISHTATLVDCPDRTRTGYNTININRRDATALAVISDGAGLWVYFESMGYSGTNGTDMPVRGFVLASEVSFQ